MHATTAADLRRRRDSLRTWRKVEGRLDVWGGICGFGPLGALERVEIGEKEGLTCGRTTRTAVPRILRFHVVPTQRALVLWRTKRANAVRACPDRESYLLE